MTTCADDLIQARAHLSAAQRLLRGVFALRALAAVTRAIRLVDVLLSHGPRPVQPRLALEATDGEAPSA